MSYLKDKIKEQVSEKFINDLEEYAQMRRNCVKEKRETGELAALLVEKYGFGLVTAAKILELNTQGIYDRLDKLVEGIDPRARATRQKRWNGRPAGLSFGKEPPDKMDASSLI